MPAFFAERDSTLRQLTTTVLAAAPATAKPDAVDAR